jgi:hypothetical protein
MRAHPIDGQRDGGSSDAVIASSALIGVAGPLPKARVDVTISVGDGPSITGHTRVT